MIDRQAMTVLNTLAALVEEGGADYIILDGRGGGTGAAPLIFRNHISVPTIPALARARRHLDRCAAGDVTLIVTGGALYLGTWQGVFFAEFDGPRSRRVVVRVMGD